MTQKDKKIRVLFVTHTRVMGGANHSMFQLVKELKENYDVEPTVLYPLTKTVEGSKSIEVRCAECGIASMGMRFYWFKHVSSWKIAIQYLINLFWFYPRILHALRGGQFDLVHSNGSVIDLGAIISRRKRVPHVWHLREFGWLDFCLRPVFGSWFERWTYSRGDCFIAISHRIEEEFRKVIPAEKIKLIYNGIVPKPDSLDARHDNRVMHFVITGMVQEAKNQMEAVRAIEILKAQGYAACLDIIGLANNNYADALRRYVSNHGLTEEVRLWGIRDDVPQLLSRMDVGLMLSRNEAFGRVTVEYMLQNLAVIASDTGANEEIITNGVNGLIYHYGDAEGLARQMQIYLDDVAYMQRVAAAGKAHALECFISVKNTAEMYRTYCGLVNKLRLD